ncbi:transglycosylase domain-containing protein [Antrihabitans spumae]|uniref:Transglycosylase domain-containing protein n=1 Tax=Antrihabitans spumae TaxID=3373370 RepID=A0ABW7JLX1_9NOCA
MNVSSHRAATLPQPSPANEPTKDSAGGVSSAPGASPKRPKDRSPKRKSKWRYVRRTLYVLVALAIIVPTTAFVISYSQAEVPRPSDMRVNQVATIFATDGTTVLSKVVPPEGNRTEVPISDVPEHVRNAMLSAEDRNFYQNRGFSVTGFFRAARDNIQGKESAGGGSTITQQYVKNALVGSDRSVSRKWRELVISAKMAREWSKDDILAAYLNTIYYGRGAYGIAAASKSYFGKPVGDLTVAEGAVLASVVRSPSSLDPELHSQELTARWNYVLDGMVEMGVLPSAERAANVFPPIIPTNQVGDENVARGPEGLIRTQVLNELRAAGISDQDLNTGGLQITTTIDPKAQQAAIDSVTSIFEGEPAELRTAVVSIDPRTGAVRAYYGGADGAGFDFAQAPLQTGSAFKVFGLVAALKDDIPLSAMYSSAPLTVGSVSISNVGGETCGTCTIAQALKQSLNTSFYRLTRSMENGPQKIADAAHEAGIPENIPGLPGKSLSQDNGIPEDGIVLGQYQVRPIDMASAYATLAASGTYHAPHFVQRVVTADGTVLLDRLPEPGEQRIEPAVAENVTQAMLPIASYSRGHGLAGGRPSASKTGTAQYGDTGLNKDAWMVGYTPSLSTAVWIGTEQAQAITDLYGSSIYGSGLPSDIWKKTMDGALEGTDVEKFPFPDPIGGQAGVPAYSAPAKPAPSTSAAPPPPPPLIVLPPPPPMRQIEILPGITIPIPG